MMQTLAGDKASPSPALSSSTENSMATTSKASTHLPPEIILLILIQLDHHTLLAATATCRHWRALARSYRQYLWKHLAWRDYSFTAARGLWKLEFLRDQDLRLSFPMSAVSVLSNRHKDFSSRSCNNYGNSSSAEHYLRCSICTSCQKRVQQNVAQVSAASASSLSVDRDAAIDMGAIRNTHQSAGDALETCNCVRLADRKNRPGMDNADSQEIGCSTQQSVEPDSAGEDDDLTVRRQEKDWKALYQLTSNWYRGRAKGYCPLMLPSLTTLATATKALSEISLSSSASSSSSSSAGSSTMSRTASGQQLSTPAQRAIQRILKRRKPLAVVGLQHEGSALTQLSLASYPKRNFDLGRDRGAGKKAEASCTSGRQVALIRSNPHYREQWPSRAQNSHQAFLGVNNIHGFDAEKSRRQPNIIAQDPNDHVQATFAIQSSSSRQYNSDIGGDSLADSIVSEVDLGTHAGFSGMNAAAALPQQQHTNNQGLPGSTTTTLFPPSGHQISEEPANDILCHYSSISHSFLVTGHMDGSVRLWDMSIQEPRQQCIRYWQTGARRRVLCVGMNCTVVVCGNADSTLCVWDINPGPSSPLSSHGTIHAASYLASGSPPGLDNWVSGIENICVGDSLVACSTESSRSVLVFSLATGSLVYEIPGLHQPSKMCMTDFFLLTGGHGAWNQGGRTRGHHQLHVGGQQLHHNQLGVGHTNQYGDVGHDGDFTGEQQRQEATAAEVDEYMSCCINVWDLRTGARLYSLFPQLPMQHLQQTRNIASVLSDHQLDKKRGPKMKNANGGQQHTTRTVAHSADMALTQQPFHTSGDTWGTRLGLSSRSAIPLPTSIVGAGESGVVRPGDADNTWSVRQQQRLKRVTVEPPISPRRPISAPLTLLGITVTPDHSTLVATLCERSGEGREGVYCWDFSGSRLRGYHEQGAEPSTMILDKDDIEYRDGSGADPECEELSEGSQRDEQDESEDSGGGTDEESDSLYSNDRFNNNMVMQQVDSTVLRNLHLARITGKVWIGWKLDESEFQRRKSIYLKRVREKRQRALERRVQTCRENSVGHPVPDLVEHMTRVSL